MALYVAFPRQMLSNMQQHCLTTLKRNTYLTSAVHRHVESSSSITKQTNPVPTGITTTKFAKKKLVILGSGWATVGLLKSLRPEIFDVSVVSPTNYFLFTPLLPSVTVGTCEPRSITESIRKILLKRLGKDSTFYEAQCTQVDVEENKVRCSDLSGIVGEKQHFTLDYDYLVVAIGAQPATYNIAGVEEHAYQMKEISHAVKIRKNIIDSFETAALKEQSEEEKKRLLHFVVVGGGPTGVECAAELRDWIRDDLVKVYPKDVIDKAQISLLDGLNEILNTYSEDISRYAEKSFKDDGINIIKNAYVDRLDETTMYYNDKFTKEKHAVDYGMCVWCAGIGPRDLTKKIQSSIPEQNNRFGLITNHFMKVKNSRNIFALGDCSTVQFNKFSEYIVKLLDDAGIEDGVHIPDRRREAILEGGKNRFPHLTHKFKELLKSYNKLELKEGNIFPREELVKLSDQVDTKQTHLPPTAQVAVQEGKYLGKLLSKHAEELVNNKVDAIEPFSHRHLGSLAYIGMSRAVLQLPIIGDVKGYLAVWLWHAIYLNECVTMRMRTLILFDWIKAIIFGRDISRI